MKILYIIRGLPGSGKTTLAQKLTKHVASADMFFELDGEYRFDASKLGDAHAYCQGMTEQFMKLGCEAIAVANTFTVYSEAKPYIELARKYGYSVVILTCESTFKNIHDVPEATIERMRTRWQSSADWLNTDR